MTTPVFDDTLADPKLGYSIQGFLKDNKLESPIKDYMRGTTMLNAIHQLLIGLGLDLHNDSLAESTSRIATMYEKEVFYGLDYKNFPRCHLQENVQGLDELIMETDASVRSFCEHHFIPFFGVAHVGYIPKNHIIGLSKINRVVDFFSRRPQVQERLTTQIHAALSFILGTEDVGVVVEAQHLCVIMRGVQDSQSRTITSKMSGRFMTKPELRQEFMSLIPRRT